MHQKLTKPVSVSGFTLIEVMVSLLVFSVAAVALTTALSVYTGNQISLEDRTVGQWLASNRLAEIKLAGFPAVSENDQKVVLAGRDWVVTTNVSQVKMEYSADSLRQIDIRVARSATPDRPVQRLFAVIGDN